MSSQPSWLQHNELSEYVTEAKLPLPLRFARWLGHQRWIPPGRDRLLRMLYPPDSCPHILFEVDFFGQRYRGDLAHFIDWSVFCYGSASTGELSLLKACAEAIRSKNTGPLLFLDIGANVGHHTLFMAPIVDQVVSFEPFPPLQSLILEKIRLNKLSNVTLMPFGLGDKDQVLDYYPGEGSNSGEGAFIRREGEKHVATEKLQIRQGDPALEELGAKRVDLMKVDVEGFEAAVFRGLSHRIQRDQPIILTELSSVSRSQFGSERAFRQAFYPGAHFAAVMSRNGDTFKLRPFDYEESDEILITPAGMEWLRQDLAQSN